MATRDHTLAAPRLCKLSRLSAEIPDEGDEGTTAAAGAHGAATGGMGCAGAAEVRQLPMAKASGATLPEGAHGISKVTGRHNPLSFPPPQVAFAPRTGAEEWAEEGPTSDDNRPAVGAAPPTPHAEVPQLILTTLFH